MKYKTYIAVAFFIYLPILVLYILTLHFLKVKDEALATLGAVLIFLIGLILALNVEER